MVVRPENNPEEPCRDPHPICSGDPEQRSPGPYWEVLHELRFPDGVIERGPDRKTGLRSFGPIPRALKGKSRPYRHDHSRVVTPREALPFPLSTPVVVHCVRCNARNVLPGAPGQWWEPDEWQYEEDPDSPGQFIEVRVGLVVRHAVPRLPRSARPVPPSRSRWAVTLYRRDDGTLATRRRFR
jgi:hypothetical protein